METSDLVEAILDGKYDDDLDTIQGALKDRWTISRAIRDKKALAQINVGDEVRTKNLSPKYLNGALAKVTEGPANSRSTRVSIKFQEPVNPRIVKRYGTMPVRVPVGCLEKV